MPHRARILSLLVLLSLAIAPRLTAGAHPSPTAVRPLPPTPMWTATWDVAVRTASSDGAPALTRLDIDQELRVTGATTDSVGARWLRIRLWDTLDGYARATALSAVPVVPPNTPPGPPVLPHPAGAHASMPLRATGSADGPLRLRGGPDPAAPLLRIVPVGTPLRVTAWATDSTGQAWYRIASPQPGWGSAGHIALTRGTTRPDLAIVRGLGMWLTPPVLRTAPPKAIVATALRNGLTHLYVEVARSDVGFNGAGILDRLLPIAHRAHIAVIVWVYPFLDDLPRDVATALAVARYTTPDGERPDGLMADIEQNMGEPYVRAYGQILRAALGPHMLMAASTYAPQTYYGQRYPFRAIAASWDLVVPMDYWDVGPTLRTASSVYRYVQASVVGVRADSGDPQLPVEVLGQTFDLYQNGRHSPGAAEIRAAIAAARDTHATGISFFEWNHATPEEWDALAAGRSGGAADTRW